MLASYGPCIWLSWRTIRHKQFRMIPDKCPTCNREFTVKDRILFLVGSKNPIQFGEIKSYINKHDYTIVRELANLIKMKLITKKNYGYYITQDGIRYNFANYMKLLPVYDRRHVLGGKVLHAMSHNGTTTFSILKQRLGWADGAIGTALARYVKQGLVIKTKHGQYIITPRGKRLVKASTLVENG